MAQTVLWIGVIPLLVVFIIVAIPMITTARDLEMPSHPSETDRCPVCGMLVSPFPGWTAQVRHRDGTTVFFDGCKDLFKYLLSLDRYAPRKASKNVAAVFVTNYYDGEIIVARTAFFVVGSDVMGPMGRELVPHRSLEAAKDFTRDHNGLRILRFDEVTKAILHELM